VKNTSPSPTWKQNRKGYFEAYSRDHPLRTQNGTIKRHRVVLFDAIGGESHPCANCGWALLWRGPDWRHCINVDHINGIKGDDRLDNLRVLCGWCNSNRNWAERICPDEWQQCTREFASIAPWERQVFICWLAVEWGIGSTDLLWAVRAEMEPR
jgi:hypothetical protein